LLYQEDNPLDKQLAVAACKRLFLRIPQRLERSNQTLKGRLKLNKDIDRPHEICVQRQVLRIRRIGLVDVELQVVLEKELQDDVDGEHVLVETGAVTQVLDFQGDDFPGKALVSCDGISMGLFDEVGPCRADVGDVAVVGGVVDEEAYIVVCCLIGVLVIELIYVNTSRIDLRGTLPHREDEFGRLDPR
jgi:hypothetical protein